MSDADAAAKFGAAEPVRPATTGSMQNLLAQYLEAQTLEPPVELTAEPAPAAVSSVQDVPFEAHPGHALNASQSETRQVTTIQTAEIVPVSPSMAAFVPMPPKLVAPVDEPSVATSPSVIPLPVRKLPDSGPTPQWPESAVSLIESLRQENDRLRQQLLHQTQQLHSAQDLADSDVLTPTLNRRAFLREVHRAMADCKRYGEEACLIYVDMDGFKSVNDSYGHAAGDAALIYVADTLKASVREGDSIGRMGGDEFAVLLRRADLKSSRIKAMKLEAELTLGTFEHGGLYLKVGGSFGVRAYANQPSAEAWLSEADAAMFLVKKASR